MPLQRLANLQKAVIFYERNEAVPCPLSIFIKGKNTGISIFSG